jgi:hypothetical protein
MESDLRRWMRLVETELGPVYVAYHGPTKGRDFDQTQWRVPAFFTSSRDYAARYIDPDEDDGAPIRVKLTIRKPKIFDASTHEMGADCEELAFEPSFQKQLAAGGYDGLIVVDGEITDYVVFNPAQIEPYPEPV